MSETIAIYDTRAEGNETLDPYPRMTTYEQVQATFHITVNRSKGWDAAPGGAQVFKLVAFEVRTGSPSFLATVVNADSSPRPSVLINAHYPNFEVEPNWTPRPAYHSLAFGDFTNSTGVWGLPVGHLYTTPEGGPVTLWPDCPHDGVTPPQYSDAVFGIGYMGGTQYLAAHPIWRVVTKEGDTPLPPTGDYILVYLNGQVVLHVKATPGEPPSGFTGLVGAGWYVAGTPGAPA